MRKNVTYLLLLLLSFILFTHSQTIKALEVKGKITYKNSQKILSVWGNRNEMGYAHGYLLGNDIKTMIEKYLIAYLLQGSTTRWNQSVTVATTKMQFRKYEEEFTGLYQGMKDAGTNMYVAALGRDLTLNDLKLWATVYDNNLIIPQCSSFAAWGSSTADGTTIHGRNFDFPYDTQNGYAVSNLTIHTFAPDNGQKYMFVSWPGFLAPVSGMNESGLALTVNVSNGATTSTYPRTDYMPMGLLLRDVLEETTGTNPVSQAESILGRYPVTRSGNVMVSQADRAEMIEVDASGLSVRTNYNNNSYVFASNHAIARPQITSASGGSISRYNLITNTLQNLVTNGDKKVDTVEATSLLQQLTQNTSPTVHSIIFHPAKKTMEIFFGKISGSNPVQVTLSPYTTPTTYTWNDFFGTSSKPGDADGNGKVDGVDYIKWLNHYGVTTTNGASDGDFNADSKVNGIDYITWLNNYGQ